MIRLGAQVSAVPGFEAVIDSAKNAGVTTLQLFTRNPVGGQGRPLPRAGSLAERLAVADIRPLFFHAPYFVNPAAVDEDMKLRAHRVLQDEMRRVKRLSGHYLVIHPGHQQAEREKGLEALVATVVAMLKRPGRILIENASGQGKELGASFDELGCVFSSIGKTRRVGLMLDTAHAMAYGYPLRSATDWRELLSVIERTIGLDRVCGIHLNDNMYPAGSHRDRHAALLMGDMGRDALHAILQTADQRQWPLVLETPGRDLVSRCDDFSTVVALVGDDNCHPLMQKFVAHAAHVSDSETAISS